MKKILALFCVLPTLLMACTDSAKLDSEKIYMFYSDTCSHCHNATAYIDAKYPDLEMERVDVATENGRKLLFECAAKFKLGNRVGTPLFCMGDKYIMGWSTENARLFNRYVRTYLRKNK